MKRTLAGLTLGLALLGLPAAAQQSGTVQRPEALEQAAEQLRVLAPTEAQTQGLMDLLMRELPRIMDENADPVKFAREIQPEAARLLNSNQMQMLEQMSAETGPLMQFGSMSREERRRLIQGGLERLNHPDTKEWLRRIDSFDI